MIHGSGFIWTAAQVKSWGPFVLHPNMRPTTCRIESVAYQIAPWIQYDCCRLKSYIFIFCIHFSEKITYFLSHQLYKKFILKLIFRCSSEKSIKRGHSIILLLFNLILYYFIDLFCCMDCQLPNIENHFITNFWCQIQFASVQTLA